MKYILVIDAGTSSTRTTVFDVEGNEICRTGIERNLYYPAPGSVEGDAMETWYDVKNTLLSAVEKAGIDSKDILSVSLTGQRESCIAWDKNTGEPLSNLLTWQDVRTADITTELASIPENNNLVHTKNGMMIIDCLSAPKYKWMLDNIPNLREQAEAGKVWFGTIESWLIYNMTGGKRVVTEATYTSRTALLDYQTMAWDDELLEMFGIPKVAMITEILPSDAVFGNLTGVFENDIPIAGVFGDHNAAMFGNYCYEIGDIKVTLGTSANMDVNVGHVPQISPRVITSMGWKYKGEYTFFYESASLCCGDTAKWLKKGLGVITSVEESEQLAESVESTNGLRFVNSFYGIYAPEFVLDSRGVVVGMNITHDKRHFVRAALESVALDVIDTYQVMQEEFKELDFGKLNVMYVDGGVARNKFIMQMLADILNEDVVCRESSEITTLGAFYLSGLVIGLWKDLEELRGAMSEKHFADNVIFKPTMGQEERDRIKSEWRVAKDISKVWAEKMRG